MDAADQEPDPEKRMELYAEAEKVIVDRRPGRAAARLAEEIWLRQPWVRGFHIHPVWLVRYEKLSISPP